MIASEETTSAHHALSTVKSSKALEHVIYLTGYPKSNVAVQAMALLAALLYQGNETVQSLVLNVCQHRTTGLFVQIDDIIHNAKLSLQRASSRLE